MLPAGLAILPMACGRLPMLSGAEPVSKRSIDSAAQQRQLPDER
jgi:hypothetical protein